MRSPPRIPSPPSRCNASPRCVLGRARSLRLRTLPASLRDSRFAAGRARSARRVTADRDELERGLELIDRGEYFAAHEVLEDLWCAAEAVERDFFQGLVHVAVAWHHAGRGNRPGCERQLAKAARRLEPFAPEHRGVDVAAVLASVAAAQRVVESGSLELPNPLGA